MRFFKKGETAERAIETKVPDMPDGVYQFGITLRTLLGPTLNSPFVKIKIGNDDR